MLVVVETGLHNFGRPTTLNRADQLLMTLMYWREYRTEFHIGLPIGISQSTACHTIQKVENVLIQSKQFHLRDKKELQPRGTIFEIMLVGAAEQPLNANNCPGRQCQGKDKNGITAAQWKIPTSEGLKNRRVTQVYTSAANCIN